MRKLPWVIAVFVLGGLAVLFAAPQSTEQAMEKKVSRQKPSGKLEKVSYSLGVDVGTTIAKQGLDVDSQMFLQGIRDGLAGTEPLLSQEEMQSTLMEFQQEVAKKRAEEQAQSAAANKKEAEQFLAENKKKEAVKVAESGLQYEVLEQGTGKSPDADDRVKVHYRGTLLSGEEFDSSYSRGEPTEFRVGQVIEGWKEAIQKMKEGGHWKIYLPPELAYGERGVPPTIGPNEVLIFDVKLLGVTKQEAPQQEQSGE